MKGRESRPRLVSKFSSTYGKLFEGFTPQEISPQEDPSRFWSNLLSLNVDGAWLSHELEKHSIDELLNFHKPFLNTLLSACLFHLRNAQYGDSRKANAVDTLAIVIRCCLVKNPTGWEVMEIFAGGVAESDGLFLDLMGNVDSILADRQAPPSFKHRTLQLTVVFACGISQLSPGAYLLRRNLFPAIIAVIKSPETKAYTFEAALLLSILANFHKSDAAKLNPYLRSLKDVDDRELLRNICWSANFALDRVVKAYQAISDDSPPTFATSVGNLFASFRPDRALSSTPVDPPKELFKQQPIEAAVILLPIYEFLHLNPVFAPVLLEPLLVPQDQQTTSDGVLSLPHTILTLSSYLLTHASSTSSPRAVAYANLCLNIILQFAENNIAMSAFMQRSKFSIRLCRQRLPLLPLSTDSHLPAFALLDCCVLWLKHNLHKRLEVYSYTTCIWILCRVVWFLSKQKLRLDYHWQELWRALFALLGFLANKLDNLEMKGGVERLMQETVLFIDFALCNAESFIGTPQAVHQFVYEVVRSSSALEKQKILFQNWASRTSKTTQMATRTEEALKNTTNIAEHYSAKVKDSKAQSATEVLRVIAKEVDRDGLFGARDKSDDDPPRHTEDVVDLGFIRFAYLDGMALMPGPD